MVRDTRWFDPDKACCWPKCRLPRTSASYCRKHYNEYHRRWRARNQVKTSGYFRNWLDKEGSLVSRRRGYSLRREQKALVRAVVVESSKCALCKQTIDFTLRAPHPMSATLGHEPPLSRCKALGVAVVKVRPEHLTCNQWKWNRLDSELVGKELPLR